MKPVSGSTVTGTSPKKAVIEDDGGDISKAGRVAMDAKGL